MDGRIIKGMDTVRSRFILGKIIGALTVAVIVGFSFVVPTHAEEKTVEITVPFADDTFDIQVDGVTVPLHKTGSNYEVTVKDSSDFVTAIQYYDQSDNPVAIYSGGTRSVPDGAYPAHMKVWEVNTMRVSENGTQVLKFDVRNIPDLDDALGYEGFAIKPPSSDGKVSGGIRCTLSVPNTIRDSGVTFETETIYTLEEYGHLHIFSRNWNSTSSEHMTMGDQLVIPVSCYKKGVCDYVLATENGRTQFANSLYDIVDYNTDKNFRGFIKLKKVSTKKEVYLYGPIVGRNPYYVAKQLKEAGYPGCGPQLTAYINAIVSGVEGNTLPDMEVYFIGDSLMMGMTLKDGLTSGSSFKDYVQVAKSPSVLISNGLAQRYRSQYGRVKCSLYANGGATYSEPGANLHNMPELAGYAVAANGDPKFIFLWAGVNDWAYADQGEGDGGNKAVFGVNYRGTGLVTNEFEQPGTIYPETDRPYTRNDKSYCIGIDRTIKMLSDKYPAAKIIVCSPLRALWDSGPGTQTINRSSQKNLNQYSYVQGSIANYNRNNRSINSYFVNLYDKTLAPMGLPTNEGAVPEKHTNFKKYFPDGYHPNQSGYSTACEVVLSEMQGQGLIPAP